MSDLLHETYVDKDGVEKKRTLYSHSKQWRVFRALACKYGFDEAMAEDLATEAFIVYYKTNWRNANHCLVKAMKRLKFNYSRTFKEPLNETRDILEELSDLERPPSFEEAITMVSEPQAKESELDADLILNDLKSSDRAIFVLIHKWGFSFNEVGDCFGVTDARIYQRYSDIQKRVQEKVRKEIPGRESRKGSGDVEGLLLQFEEELS